MIINIQKTFSLKNGLTEEDSFSLDSSHPYQIKPIEEEFKYLGVFLNPLSYCYEDWLWFYKKIEDCISCWNNCFLSICGCLVLLQEVAQSIAVYHIAAIAKGILTKIQKIL